MICCGLYLNISGGRLKYNQAHAFINSNPNVSPTKRLGYSRAQTNHFINEQENANSMMNNSSSDSNIDNPNGMCDMVEPKMENYPIMIKSVKCKLKSSDKRPLRFTLSN